MFNSSIDVFENRNYLFLHMKGLNMLSSQLFTANGVSIPILDAFPFKKNEYWVILTEETLPPGAYILRFDFNGDLSGSVVGMFQQRLKSSLQPPNDESENLIVFTHMEPQYARRVFPCFDEPSFKATFSVRLVKPDGYTALSNMPQLCEVESCPRSGNSTVTFDKTPPMSTYLLAFVITNFKPTPVLASCGGVPIRVFAKVPTHPDVLNTQKLALDAMDWMENYFKISYPLPKLDILAVPDFASGAMENWGMIIIREMKMSRDADVIDWETINYTMGHELANQWFGNLATIVWWDDIWLKEGMAMFLSNLMLDDIFPEMQGIPNFVEAQLHRGLVSDATLCTRQLLQQVIYPCDIADVFDAITYTKAAAILRMFESTNPDKFRKGVQNFIHMFKYSNGTSQDLWRLIDDSVHAEDWVHAFNTWVGQPGYPLILAARGTCTLAVQQIRCLNDIALRFDTQDSPYQFRWDVPIQYVTSLNPCEPELLWLSSDEKEARADLPSGVCWFKMNIRQHGFYRVTYHQQEWMNLREVLLNTPEVLTPEDRANLLDDSFFLAHAGFVCYGIPLQLATYLRYGKEDHWLPWATFSKHLSLMRNALSNDEKDVETLFEYARSIVDRQLTDELWFIEPSEPIKDRKYKLALLKIGCKLRIPHMIEQVGNLFQTWSYNPHSKDHVDIRRVIVKHGITNRDAWLMVFELYLTERDTIEKCLYLESLASIKDPELCQKLLDHMLTENKPDDQELFLVLFTMANNPIGNKEVWAFIKSNWDALLDKYYLSETCLGLVLPHIAQFFNTEEQLDDMKEFLKGKQITSAICSLDQIQHNLNWNTKYRKILLGWLNLLLEGKVC
ncbi:glutamyl aminopeptidase-like isoform X2 [Cimex lectularius]|uniref:Aminopeptidase n=1 Tax=Cimex lectularius TaxID=79782 RepID=A0A8I6RI90_CIMLE|nr:glutamyl aminopeptidase-like isoform X2 [Cimex lectularius]XP_014246804.1 glutamyl aminopeptidase-like isoform X2 [Cimex lectularius]